MCCITQTAIDSQYAYFRLAIPDDMKDIGINSIRVTEASCGAMSSAVVKLPYRRYDDIKDDKERRTELDLVSRALDAARRNDYQMFRKAFSDSEEHYNAAEMVYEHLIQVLTGGNMNILGVCELPSTRYYFIDFGLECKTTFPVYADDYGKPYLRLCTPLGYDFPDPGVQLHLGPEFTNSPDKPFLSFPWGPDRCASVGTVFIKCSSENETVRRHIYVVRGIFENLRKCIQGGGSAENLAAAAEHCISGGSRDLFLQDCDFEGDDGRRSQLVSLLNSYESLLSDALHNGRCVLLDMNPHYALVPLPEGNLVDSQSLRHRAQYGNSQGFWNTPHFMVLYQEVDDRYLLSHMLCSSDYTRFLSAPAFRNALSSYITDAKKQ